MDSRNLRTENKKLKYQLELAKDEINTIKSSRVYSFSRLAGHAKSEIKKSPVKFAKKTIKRIIRGSNLNSAQISHSLSLADRLASEYKTWISFNEPDSAELASQRNTKFKNQPLISIVTPVFNPPAKVLQDLIDSVLSQTYPRFELCLGNFGESEEVKEIISQAASKDPRIKNWVFRKNEGIAENSNKILKRCKGEFIALLDHDDELSPDALFENIKKINEADYDYIYSDKDKIDESGNRFDPFFKSGWSPETMLNANYLTHLNVMRTSVVREIGGWSSDTDGAQDWDIFLKVIAATSEKKVAHIPKVLYHWRVIATSTAMSIETKPYALNGQRVAIDRYLKLNKIPATSYHSGAELLLKWRLKTAPVLIAVHSQNESDLRMFLSSMEYHQADAKICVFHEYALPNDIKLNFSHVKFARADSGYLNAVTGYVTSKYEYVLFWSDKIKLDLTTEQIDNLRGWLSIEGVNGSSPRVIDASGNCVYAGAFFTPVGTKPVFYGSPPYHQAAIGNVEWVRNFKLLNPYIFMTSTNNLKTIKNGNDDNLLDLQARLSNSGRLVFNPKVIACFSYDQEQDPVEQMEEWGSKNPTLKHDSYYNQNLSPDSPMHITQVVGSEYEEDHAVSVSSEYQNEALIHARTWSLSNGEISDNKSVITNTGSKEISNIKTAVFILPDFEGVYAGLNNIFSFASNLSISEGTKVCFAIMSDRANLDVKRDLLKSKYPQLAKSSTFCLVSMSTVQDLPESDIAVCTQWASAYILAKYNSTKRKLYFIQDKEASFYPKGTISGLVESTYGMGFYAIANTEGLLNWYQKEYGGEGIVIKSYVDLSSYVLPEKLNLRPNNPYKVFFYARPNEPRNAFELGAASLKVLKKRLGRNIEIFCAGAEWDPSLYDLEDVVINLGKIPLDKLGVFYRSMDAGVMFMFSGHPGVVASELMANGCPVVVNRYEDSTWHELYQNGATCIVAEPNAIAVEEALYRLLTDSSLRESVIKTARFKVEDFYSGYEDSIILALEKIKRGIK